MNTVLEQAKQKRTFVSPSLSIDSWQQIAPYFDQLQQIQLVDIATTQKWMLQRSELEAVLEEELAWRYIRMNCNTQDETLAHSFQQFVSEIQPEVQKASNNLDKKILACPFIGELPKEYAIALRDIQNRESLFCEANVPIIAELQQQEQEYGVINSKMTVLVAGEEKTLQQAAVYLKSTDRELRKTVFEAISERRLQDADILHELLTQLIQKRHTIAVNAGYKNYRDYKLQELGRFDYTKEDCFNFHASIAECVPPIVAQIQLQRRTSLGYEVLKPWDTEVDAGNKPALVPFISVDEFIKKSVACFNSIKSTYGMYLETMYTQGYMDLDSRIGKAPGGFNYPLYESNMPFIYMNAAGTIRDVETIMHEGGHALHSFFSAHLPLVESKSLPSEVAELASMSMELISMEHWYTFFDNPEDVTRAKISQLEGILSILSWIAVVDEFQHRLYENPTHTVEQRTELWLGIMSKHETYMIDWTEWEHVREVSWQKQLHIYEVPFYYIEYGIAQLGAIAMWKQYKENPQQTLLNYEAMLQTGYTCTIPEIYAKAGIQFNFSKDYVNELLQYVYSQLQDLYRLQ